VSSRSRTLCGRMKAVGEAAGDARRRVEGLYNRAPHQTVRLGDVIKEQPIVIVSVLIAPEIGYPLGRLTRCSEAARVG
jgi:hypothetical protein